MEIQVKHEVQNKGKGIAIATKASITTLPAEILHVIFKNFSSPYDINALGLTCSGFYRISKDDFLWKPIVLSKLPAGTIISSPAPCDNYRELYWSHNPYWFIPQRKIWFNDLEPRGGIILTKYNQKNGNIEAFDITAIKGTAPIERWERDLEVAICGFNPSVTIETSNPVIFIPLKDRYRAVVINSDVAPKYFKTLRPITTKSWKPRKQFILTRFLHPGPDIVSTLSTCKSVTDGEYLWPYTTIPVPFRTINKFRRQHFLSVAFLTSNQDFPEPYSNDEICQYSFKLQSGDPSLLNTLSMIKPRSESCCHYGSIDPDAYTPTKKYPFRGIFVGDYSAHGIEFILIKHEDSSSEPPKDSNDWEEILSHVSGKLTGVKITGDPNVPAGKVSFKTEEISIENGQDIVGEDEFLSLRSRGEIQGTGRVVKSQGYISNEYAGKFIETETFLLSPDLIGQHWKLFGQISFYRRVDIDKLLQDDY